VKFILKGEKKLMLGELNGFIKNLRTVEEIAIQQAMEDAIKDEGYLLDLIDRYPLEFYLSVNAIQNGEHNLLYSKYNGGCNFEIKLKLDESILSKEAQGNINELIEKINTSQAVFDDNYLEVKAFSHMDSDEGQFKLIEKRIDTSYDWFTFSEQWFATDLFVNNLDAIVNTLKENEKHFSSRFTTDWDDILSYYEVNFFEQQ
jgi:hypothetical protein